MKYQTIQVPINEIPLSVNHIYGSTKQGIRYLTKEAKAFKRYIQDYVCYIAKPDFYIYNNKEIEMQIMLHLEHDDLYTKAGKIRKIDVDNMLKLLLDGLFDTIEIDDSQIFKLTIEKRVVEHDRMVTYKIRECE